MWTTRPAVKKRKEQRCNMQCKIIPWLKTSNRAVAWENDNVRSRLGEDREPLNNYTKCNYVFHLPHILNKVHIKSKPKSVFHIGTTDTNKNSICESVTQWSIMSKNYLTVFTEWPWEQKTNHFVMVHWLNFSPAPQYMCSQLPFYFKSVALLSQPIRF